MVHPTTILASITALLLIGTRSIVFAQTDETVRLWQARTESITNNLSTDINKLAGPEKSAGYARLGEAWWKHDPAAGRRFFDKAIDYATSPASLFKDQPERLGAQRELLQVIATKDAEMSRKLARKIVDEGEELAEKDDEKNNEAILKAATSLLVVDANQAFTLASLTLRPKRPVFSFSSLVFVLGLAKKDVLLANRYFATAVNLAREKSVSGMFGSLVRAAYPHVSGESRSSFVNASNQRNLLEALAIQFAMESAAVLEGRSPSCSLASHHAPLLRMHFELFLPDKLTLLDQVMSVCRISGPSDLPGVSETPKSIDELLRRAGATSDPEKKAELLMSASFLAINQREFRLAFDTLLSVREEHRSKPFGMWEAALMQAATPVILDQIKGDDFTGVNHSVSLIPQANRPLIRIEVAYKLDKDTYRLLRKDIIDEGRKELAKVVLKPPKNVQVLLSSPELCCTIVNLYRKLGFDQDAIETHEESIAAVNRYLSHAPEDTRSETISALPIRWSRYSNFDGEFLDIYFLRIENSLSKIEYAPVRREIEFGWLQTAIKRLTQVTDEMKPRKEKNRKAKEAA